MKIPLLVRAVAVSKTSAISCKFTCSQSSSLIAQKSHEKIKLNNHKAIAEAGSGCKQAWGHEL
jgi:hypothetical protein